MRPVVLVSRLANPPLLRLGRGRGYSERLRERAASQGGQPPAPVEPALRPRRGQRRIEGSDFRIQPFWPGKGTKWRELKSETVVLFVSADPEPGDDVAFAQANRSIAIANANDANPIAPFFKVERNVIRVAFPQCIFFSCEFLSRCRQCFEGFPEASVSPAGHGRSSSLPARISSRTSSSSGRSLPPSSKSASI